MFTHYGFLYHYFAFLMHLAKIGKLKLNFIWPLSKVRNLIFYHLRKVKPRFIILIELQYVMILTPKKVDLNLIACLSYLYKRKKKSALGIKPKVIQFRFLKLKKFWMKKVSEYSYMFLLSAVSFLMEINFIDAPQSNQLNV